MIVEWLTSPVLETEPVPNTGFVEIHQHWGVIVIFGGVELTGWHRIWTAGAVIS